MPPIIRSLRLFLETGTLKKFALGLSLVCLSFATTAVAETATLKVRFVYAADAPKPSAVSADKDAAFCGKHDLVEEKLVVGKDGGIKNVVLSIFTGRGGTKLGKQSPRSKTHTLANENCRFEPHVIVAQAGDTLEITNPDDVGHNANLGLIQNKAQNLTIPSKQSVKIELPEAEPGAMPVDCNIHPWMKSFLLVLDHPFGAASDETGTLTIEGMPAGEELSFRVFLEAGSVSELTEKESGKKIALKKSRFDLKLKPGMNDLGTLVVPEYK
jgi:plastocyanin